MTLKKIKQGKIDPIYVVIGEEKYLAQKVKKSFLSLIPDEEKEFNVGQYDMQQTPLSVALNDAKSVPFFGERRLVIINNPYFLTGERNKIKIEHDLNELIDYVNDPLQSTILVIFAPYQKLDERKKVVKDLKNNGQIIDNQKLNEKQVANFVMDRLKEDNFEITSKAFNLLLERTSAKLDLVMKEIDKLELSVLNTQKITEEQVRDLVPKTLEQNVFDLVDLVMNHDIKRALMMYQDLLNQKEEPIKINAILIGQFRLLLQVKILYGRGYSQGEIVKSLKIHPYRIKLAMRKINHFKIEDLERGFLGLFDIESKLKTTQQDPRLLFQLFLFKFDQK